MIAYLVSNLDPVFSIQIRRWSKARDSLSQHAQSTTNDEHYRRSSVVSLKSFTNKNSSFKPYNCPLGALLVNYMFYLTWIGPFSLSNRRIQCYLILNPFITKVFLGLLILDLLLFIPPILYEKPLPKPTEDLDYKMCLFDWKIRFLLWQVKVG